MAPKQISLIYSRLLSVTPKQAALIFSGLALLTIVSMFFSLNSNNPYFIQASGLLLISTLFIGTLGVISWLIDKFIKDEEKKILCKNALRFGVICYLLLMGLTILHNIR
jgi:uncharacterized membrane protein